MSTNDLFDSKTAPIPAIRRDLQIIPIQKDRKEFLYFHDELGYATPNFALNKQVEGLLSLLDGQKSIEDLKPYLGDDVTPDQLLEFIRLLDKHRLLRSTHFKQHAEQIEDEYEASDVHRSVTAGQSYPADADELTSFLDEAFSNTETNHSPALSQKIRALYAPHIDPRVGLESYVKAFSAIRDLTPKRVVVLATSHYAGLHPNIYKNKPFVAVDKNFELPLGTIQSDTETIEQLMQQSEGTGLTACDRAHRMEHSIELHLLFLSYLWNHDYSIIPVLVNGLDDLLYAEKSHRAKQVEAFGKRLNELFGSDRNTFFLISGDLAHIGKKFGDRQPAQSMFEEVKTFDQSFLNAANRSDTERMLSLMKKDYDPYRICGFPPLYTFLKTFPDLEGKQLSYDLWDEQERESAVSFSSILYRSE